MEKMNQKATIIRPTQRTTQKAPRMEEFNIDPKDRKGPKEATQQQRTVPEWVATKENVSTRNVNPWDEIENESYNLFGKSPQQMIRECNEFVEYTRNMDRVDKQAAYLRFLKSISQCLN